MSKSKSKSKSKSATNKGQTRSGKARPRMRQSPGKYNPLADIRVAKWDACLRDPCGSELAHPCYSGTDQGYLVRTVETRTVSYTGTLPFTIGQLGFVDCVYQYSPGSTSSSKGVTVCTAARGLAATLSEQGPGVGMLSVNTVVEQYRPVASCLRWVPDGPYGYRAGSVGLGYSPSRQYQAGDSVTALGALRQCSEIATNGAPRRDAPGHEVRWLPGSNDGGWITYDASSVPTNTASMYLVLSGIDATATSTTQMTANGYIELVTIWEWTPAIGTQATAAPRAPIPYTTQEVLATIGDMGAYLFAGVRKAGSGVVQAAVNEGMRYLTAGYGGSRTRGPPFITY